MKFLKPQAHANLMSYVMVAFCILLLVTVWMAIAQQNFPEVKLHICGVVDYTTNMT